MEFRLDRLITLSLMAPLGKLRSGPDSSIPILMYHSISDDSEIGVHPYYRTATSPRIFAAQMRYLRDNGYRTTSVSEIIGLAGDNTPASQKHMVITFDDGYRDFYTEAFPILQNFGFSATMYLPTAYIGNTPVQFKSKDCLTWAEVRELNRHGIIFGSHTVTHPQLHDLSTAAANHEITDSKMAIEQELGCEVESFAYPYAFPETDEPFKQCLRDMLSSAGYKNGVCTTIGRFEFKDDEFFLRRLPVNCCDDSTLFGAKLAGAYDWLATPQYLSKVAKSWTRPSHYVQNLKMQQR